MTLNSDHTDDSHRVDDSVDVELLIQQLDRDAAAPDVAELQRIRNQLRPAFQAATSTMQASQPPGESSRIRRSLQGLTVLAAVLAVLVAVLILSPTQAQTLPSLGDVIAKLERASAIEIEVRGQDVRQQLQYRAPGIVRWADGTNAYQIADGSRLWKIDETAGTVDEQSSPLPEEGVSAFSWLELSGIEHNRLDNVLPSGTEQIDGRSLLVYSTTAEWKREPVEVRAYVEPKSQELMLLRLIQQKSAAPVVAAEIRLTRMESAAADHLFAPRKSLRDDGRTGVVTDVKGLVSVRAFPGHRWTPAYVGLPVFAGDQFRCESTGPNAVAVQLRDASELLVGPGATFDVKADGTVRLLGGEFRVTSGINADSHPIAGPDGSLLTQLNQPHSAETAEKTPAVGHFFVRVASHPVLVETLTVIPKWYESLESSLTPETLGSLVAQIEGRDTSLTIGYHHVSVEIRDQIARTVIEESFVNNTDERLEGQFQFPLPPDASISGFGMWIGSQLVEADIVEKQRAREIFEIIRHENRDPGLLEWMGGNLFKARVFPIEPHSEKRIRITYTQTLPLQGNAFRYRYPLRSEMLRQNPLRDLSIDVTLYSERSVSRVESPSHPLGTVDLTPHAAKFHWDGRNVTPGHDFELICQHEDRQSDVTVIPYLKGDDGYFMVQFTPPSVMDGNWSRPMVADGSPLDVLILCDTSQSMNAESRRVQLEAVRAMLNCLADSDKVRLACCDGEIAWLQQDSTHLNADVRTRLLTALKERPSLGWSDLQTAFQEMAAVTDERTVVVYLGDGSVVTDDPASRSRFLTWLSARGTSSGQQPTIHAIGTSGTCDDLVLNAMSRCGRGTSRILSGSLSPESAIRELLVEISRPGLKQIQVEFRNVDVAAVYPRELPNLADGQQHLLFGRFLPGQQDESGELLISGLLAGERVTYAARLRLSETRSPDVTASSQNSFVPRQWAQAHIDHLLAEPPSEQNRSRVIGLSEEFHLITPFTSLLVLETDADRERFGVRKQMQIEDGEEFFAKGREEAEYTLRQLEIEKARLWRSQMQATLQTAIKSPQRLLWPTTEQILKEQILSEQDFSEHWGWAKPGSPSDNWSDAKARSQFWSTQHFDMRVLDETLNLQSYRNLSVVDFEFDGVVSFSAIQFDHDVDLSLFSEERSIRLHTNLPAAKGRAQSRYLGYRAVRNGRQDAEFLTEAPIFGMEQLLADRPRSAAATTTPDLTATLCDSIVHQLPYDETSPDTDITRQLTDIGAAELARALSSLSDEPRLMTGGAVIQSQTESLHPVSGRKLRSQAMSLVWNPSLGWVMLPAGSGAGHPNVSWSVGDHSGILNRVTSIGRTEPIMEPPTECRAPVDLNIRVWSFLPDGERSDLRWQINSAEPESNQTEVIVWSRLADWAVTRILVDTARNCVLQVRKQVDGHLVDQWQYGDHIQIAGRWIPARRTHQRWDPRNAVMTFHQVQTLQFEHLSDEESRGALEKVAELLSQSRMGGGGSSYEKLTVAGISTEVPSAILVVRSPLPSPEESRRKANEQTAELEHTLVLASKLVQEGRHVEARTLLLEDLTRRGLLSAGRWLTWSLTRDARMGEEYARETTEFASELLKQHQQAPIESLLMEQLWSAVLSLTDGQMRRDDRLQFLLQLESLLREQIPLSELRYTTLTELMKLRGELRQRSEQYKTSMLIRGSWGHELRAHLQLIEWLQQHRRNEVEEAFAYALSKTNTETFWSIDDLDSLFGRWVQWHRERGEFQQALDVTKRWTSEAVASANAHEQHLRSLVDLDQIEEIHRHVTSWLAAADQELTPLSEAQLKAATTFARGRVGELSLAGPERQYYPALYSLAQKWVTSRRQHDTVSVILQDQHLWETVESESAAKAIVVALGESIDQILDDHLAEIPRYLPVQRSRHTPDYQQLIERIRVHIDAQLDVQDHLFSVRRLTHLLFDLQVLMDQTTSTEKREEWFGKLMMRLRATEDKRLRETLVDLVLRYDSAAFPSEHQLETLRMLEQEGKTPQEKADMARRLFSALTAANSWTKEREEESLNVIERCLNSQPTSVYWLTEKAELLQQWLSFVEEGYSTALVSQEKGWDQLSQRQQETLKATFRTQAKLHALDRCRHACEGIRADRQIIPVVEKPTEQMTESLNQRLLAQWWLIQKIQLMTDLVQDRSASDHSNEQTIAFLTEIRELCKALPEDRPVVDLIEFASENSSSADASVGVDPWKALRQLHLRMRNSVLQFWIFSIFELQQLQPADEAQQVELASLLAYLQHGQLQGAAAQRAFQAAEFALLMALDRVAELEGNIRSWIRADDKDSPWRIYLAQLLAELDRLDEAIRLYEDAGERDLLSSEQWTQLSVWQHALDRRQDSETSKRAAVLHASTDIQLQALQQKLSAWLNEPQTRTPTVATEIREQIRLLASRSPDPNQVIALLAHWYSSTHDPLVIEPLVATVTGRASNGIAANAQRIQTFLGSMEFQTGIDVLRREIGRLRKPAGAQLQQSVVDQQALLLLELVVLGRGCDLSTDSPSQQFSRNDDLQNFVRVIDEVVAVPWASEDRLQVGELLLNSSNNPGGRQSIIRGIRRLIQAEKVGSANRLILVTKLSAFYKQQNDIERALELVEAELRQAISIPTEATGELDVLRRELFGILQGQNRFVRCEQWLRDLREVMSVEEYEQSLLSLQMAALTAKSELSSGSGVNLYRTIRESELSKLRDSNRTGELLQHFESLATVFREGTEQKFDEVATDLRKFVENDLDRITRLQSASAATVVSRISGLLAANGDRATAIRLLIDQIRKPPVAIQWTRPREMWSTLLPTLINVSYRQLPRDPNIEQVRYELYPAARSFRTEIESTLKDGLQAQLSFRQSPPEIVFDEALVSTFDGGSGSILDVFRGIAGQRPQQEAMIQWLAEMITTRMPTHQNVAVQILEQAHKDRLLSVAGKQQLATMYSNQSAWENVVVLLNEIILETHEATPHYGLMQAYFRLGKREELLSQFQLIKTSYIDPDRTDLSAVIHLADTCRSVELWPEAASLYETILRRKGDPLYPDSQVSGAWRNLGVCYAHMGQSQKLLRTSAMAWLTCGHDAAERTAVETSLRESLEVHEDLQPMLKHWEEQVAENAADSSMIRKAVARELLKRKLFSEAERQLRIAVDLQPLDSELWDLLLTSLDEQAVKQAEAVQVLLTAVEHFPRRPELFRNLHDRSRVLNLASLAQRAAQSMIESGPEEAEHFRAMAALAGSRGARGDEIRYLRRAAELRAEDPMILIDLCNRLIDDGQKTEARRVLSKIAQGQWNPQYGDIKAKLPALRRRFL